MQCGKSVGIFQYVLTFYRLNNPVKKQMRWINNDNLLQPYFKALLVCIKSKQQLWIATCCSNTLCFVPLPPLWMLPTVNSRGQLQAASRRSDVNDKEQLQGSPAFLLQKQIRHFKYWSLGCPSRSLMPISDRVISVKLNQRWHSSGEQHPTWEGGIKARRIVIFHL